MSVRITLALDDGPTLKLSMGRRPCEPDDGHLEADIRWVSHPTEDPPLLQVIDLGDYLGVEEREGVMTLTQDGEIMRYSRVRVISVRPEQFFEYPQSEVTIQ